MKRSLFLLGLIACLVPAVARAQCAGSCGTELLDNPKAVEKYFKQAWKAVATCAKKGEPSCPTACSLPDGTAEPYSLGAGCSGLLVCELQALAADVYAPQWDQLAGCPAGAADTCGLARSAAGKLVVKKLKRRRTSKMDKFARDRDKCVASVNKRGACGGESVCADAGAWIDAVIPIRLGKGGYQTLPFTAASDGEAKAVLSLSAESADWSSLEGRESVVVQYDLDGVALGVMVVNDSEMAFDYPIMLGAVTAGNHVLGLRASKKLSPASDSPVLIHTTPSVSVLTSSDAGYDALRFAPVLLGIDRQLNIVPNHLGNAVSDVPLVEYVRTTPGAGKTTYTYVMIWSNEDGGTGIYPDVLIARYGRTTDIESFVEVDVSDTGSLSEVRFRPDESGTLAVFTGAYLGTHPIVRTATRNGLIAQDGDSTLKFLLAPFEFDDTGVPRERGMDLAPHSYRVMAKEVVREAKTESLGRPNTTKLSDERNYLFVEYDISTDLDGRVLRAYAVVNGTAYGSDHYQPPVSIALDPKSIRGTAWTTIELPPGTAVGDITAVGMQGVGTMSGTLHHLAIFMLDDSYLPGPWTTFTGPVVASGLNPTWAIGP